MDSKSIIISIGGGKGGVGKSTITANIGAILSSKGFRVGFIDADLGGANLHLCLGVKRPSVGLQDFLSGKCQNLVQATIPTIIPHSWLISGASDVLELANPNFAQKQKIINQLKKLQSDFVLVDLGAGSDSHVTDFFTAFPYGIVVIDGLPTSIENAYGFLKNGTLRGLSRLFPAKSELQNYIKTLTDSRSGKVFPTIEELLRGLNSEFPTETGIMRDWLRTKKVFLILNMVRSNEDIQVGQKFAEIVKKYLSLSVYYVGYVIQSPDIRRSIKEMKPIVLYPEAVKMQECFDSISTNITTLCGAQLPSSVISSDENGVSKENSVKKVA